jgi:hypothetical protein
MAGTFGYEPGDYDISMQTAEVSLLPAVRKVPNAIVVADGTSCRHQIHDGAQREALLCDAAARTTTAAAICPAPAVSETMTSDSSNQCCRAI